MDKEEIQNQLNKILQNSNISMRDPNDLDEIPTMEIKTYSFDVLGYKLYVITQTDHLPYIKDYINSVNSGNPDKEGVIKKYAMEYQNMSESLIENLLKKHNGFYNSIPVRIIGELNQIERDLKPLLDAQVNQTLISWNDIVFSNIKKILIIILTNSTLSLLF